MTDTYTITFTDGSTTTFTINNDEYGHTPVIEIGENGNLFVNGVDTEIWMSYEFFDEPIDLVYTEDYQIDEEKSLYVAINCEAVIHETGHALGLNDYYDYKDGGVKGGVGSFAMMDANQGDHDPYSKAILGWTHSTVVVDMDYETTLRSKDLFAAGSTVSGLKWHDGTDVGVKITIGAFTETDGTEQVAISIDYQ